MENTIDTELYAKLESLSRDALFDILTKSGIVFTDAKRTELTKDELLLVADEADMNTLRSLLTLHNGRNSMKSFS